jgi:hypothetical protein
MRQTFDFSETLQDKIHISLHPAENIAAVVVKGKHEYLAEAHFAEGQLGVIHGS